MAFEKGSLIFTNYTAKVKDTGEVVETTNEEEAKKLNVYDESRRYGPRLVAVGEGWLISGLDAEVAKMQPGEKKVIELSADKAFGMRDPTQIRMIPLRKFGEREHEIEVGDSVDVDNRVGTVRFIGSGRAQVDFNHRLAGKSIVYDFEVLNKVDSDEEKVKALVDRRLGGEASKPTVEMDGAEVKVGVPEQLYLMEGLQIVKRGISNDVFKFVPTVADVTFVEKFANEKVQTKKEEPKGEAPAAERVAPKPKRKKAAPAATA
ncbi:MAG TPA: FKBP-type peptidyl-prolyl cis-trans isomerase [Nitrososphaerales archaeon]|nr:FKBP-type peptidyl-prolyl cis-trans isomerase [Nitrososphaerales archaeon]